MSVASTVVAALVGALLLEHLRVPAGALIGSMAAVAGLNLVVTFDVPTLPDGVRFATYAALGWLIGQGVTRETVTTLARSILPISAAVLALIAFGAGLGLLLHRLGVMDAATAYLATSPGALSQMGAVGASVGADASLVVAVHTTRVVMLVLLAPLIGRLGDAGLAQ